MSKRIIKSTLLIAIVLFSCIREPVSEAALRGGAARVDITPPAVVWLSGYASRNKPSDGIEDPLYAKTLVLDDGQSRIAIVSADLLWVPLDITTRVRRKVKEQIGITEENILICATHTHFGPKIDRITKDWPDSPASEVNKSYVEGLEDKIVESILTANKNLQAVKLGAAKGQAPEIVYNRRTKKPDGTVAMTFRLPAASDDLTFGPTDPEVGILRIQNASGSVLAAVVNFACHPVSGAKDAEKFYSISADYPGYTAQVVEQTEGGICLFTLGTAGNMNPVRLNRENPRSKIGKALGGEVVRRIQFAPVSSEIMLKAMKKTIVLPVKKDLPPERVKDSEKGKETLTTEIQALRLGDVYILGLPGEILVEIGLDIKKRTAIEHLFIVSLSNDACGYVCLREAYKEGGYEPDSGTNLAEGAGEIITEEALMLLAKIKQGK
ncbi:MAG: neutral/alkaline non-lysosomal ceramidase N-terminal domain-containing protein [Sedimentisphaerales bacterium]|nr:neutral/alkaline non-lysosomal ceramidase N-terminal domain-containing protein [Sedimentisphaerales bacterium]